MLPYVLQAVYLRISNLLLDTCSPLLTIGLNTSKPVYFAVYLCVWDWILHLRQKCFKLSHRKLKKQHCHCYVY